jgi:hypothetical protein
MAIKGENEELLVKQLKTCEKKMEELTESIKRPNLRIIGIEKGEEVQAKGMCNVFNKAFFAALFTIAKLWKQPRCPTTDEWIKKMWYLYTMEFYSAMKKNEILSMAGKWMELETIIVSEVGHVQKAKNCMFSLV